MNTLRRPELIRKEENGNGHGDKEYVKDTSGR
jgi:hypothetical protein